MKDERFPSVCTIIFIGESDKNHKMPKVLKLFVIFEIGRINHVWRILRSNFFLVSKEKMCRSLCLARPLIFFLTFNFVRVSSKSTHIAAFWILKFII